jgi:DNA-binding LytR/AlgR family response regulator
MTGRISCIVVEDQAPAQRVLHSYIADTPHLSLVGTCLSAVEASKVLAERAPALMFLDLHLPRVEGFAFLRSIPKPPLVIVTTADPDHALEGFDLNVVDYLLKPFSFERFLQAVTKVQSALASGEQDSAPARATPRAIFVKANGELRRVTCDEIIFISAEGDYVELFTRTGKLFIQQTLKSLEEALPKGAFQRVHKSYIVRVNAIERIAGSDIHIGGTTIPIGRSYRESFLRQINAGQA